MEEGLEPAFKRLGVYEKRDASESRPVFILRAEIYNLRSLRGIA